MLDNFNFEEESLGNFLKLLRKTKGINSIELSNSVGKSNAYVSQIENSHNQKPEYGIMCDILRKLDVEEDKIEEYLAHFGLFPAEKRAIKEYEYRKRMEEEMIQREIELQDDPDYHEAKLQHDIDRFESEMEWLETLEDELKRKNEEIGKELDYFIGRNLDTFQHVIDNLHSLIKSISKSREDYNLFTNMFKRDLIDLPPESKKIIIDTIKEEYRKNWKGWGEVPF